MSAIPFPVTPINKPAFYKEISQDKDNYALLEIPATLNYSAGDNILYYQTIHKKPIVGGWADRFPSKARDFEINTPVINELTYLQPFNADILNQDINQIGTSIFNYYNISYIILHTNYINKRNRFAETIIGNTLDTERKVIYFNDSMIAYHIKKEPTMPFMNLKDNWYGLEEWNGVPTRWTSNNATLLIYSNEKVNKNLSFQTLSYHNPKIIEIQNGNHSYERSIPTNLISIKTPLTLEKGGNVITFYTYDKCFSPAQIGESQDERELSFAMQNITIA